MRDSDGDLALGRGIGNQTPTEVGECVTDPPVAQHDWVVAYDDLHRRSGGNCYDGYFWLSDFTKDVENGVAEVHAEFVTSGFMSDG